MRVVRLITLTAILGFAAPAATLGRTNALESLVAQADAIALVEILSTDYRATAADGPMYADAKVLKVLKGNVLKVGALRFAETAWWGPNYKAGERRIVFLGRRALGDEYYKTRWHTIYTESIDFFFARDALAQITPSSLSEFLSAIHEARESPPRVEIGVARTPAGRTRLSVRVINDGHQAFWLNPLRLVASLEVNQVRYSRGITWTHGQKEAWIKMEPTARLQGFIDLWGVEMEGEDELIVILSHRSVYFPHRCWVGARSATVRLRE